MKRDSSFFEELLAMDDLIFFQHLRVTKEAFHYLLDMIKDNPPPRLHGKKMVTQSESLLITLWYLSNKTSFREVALQFRLSMSAVHKIFYKTLDHICQLADKIIKWPSDLEVTEREFFEIAGFKGAVGAIDATHIQIRPPVEQQRSYIDRTMTHSQVLLAVCDARMQFTHISTGFPGSIHDQRCLDLSQKLSAGITSPPNEYFPRHEYHLVGDTGFKLEATLMIPYKDYGNLTHNQITYNKKISKTRVIIENAFAFLKGRFRCLNHLEVDLDKVTPIIVACCIVHNVALMFPDILSVTEISTDDIQSDEHSHGNPHPNASLKREYICRNLV